MSFKSNRLGCWASGDNYYGYSTDTKPDAYGKVACPRCGKIVKLRAAQPGFRRYIPQHNRPAEEQAQAAGSSNAEAGQ